MINNIYKSGIVSKFLVFILPLALIACGGGGSSDETADTITTLTLNSATEGGSANFTALLKQPAVANTTGVVLVHGRGGNPDSAVVRQLRNDLFDRKYSTLSIQAAVPATYTEGDSVNKPPYSSYIDDVNNNANSVFLETYARIRTAINELESRGVTRIALIGFSMGSRITSAHVARGQVDELTIAGLIGIGMYAGGSDPDPLKTTFTLDEVSIPVLDIYGDNDTSSSSTAVARKAAYDSGTGTNYTQTQLTCNVSLSANDCHKLSGLKGTSTSPLELAVANWIAGL